MPCPSDDLLGALVERTLDEHEHERVTAHLDSCADCRQVVLAAVRGDHAALAAGTPSTPEARGQTSPTSGTRIGRYELRKLLGAGGMGQVFEAYDSELDRAIALKIVRPGLARGAGADRLVRESRLMARVDHPSVITVYDVGRAHDALFIAMELVRGETLASYLARVRPSWRTIVSIFERAGEGLAAAHDAGVVHRDFKPENVLVELDGERASKVIVTDFGIARATSLDDELPTRPDALAATDARLTSTGIAVGTPAYMAPEQLAAGTVDLRADVFAFSVSLWEALFGERPFTGKSVAEIRAAMAQPPRARGGVPSRLVRVLERGLAIAPRDRWPGMPAMITALARVRLRRRRAGIAAAAVGLVGAGLAGALVLVEPRAEDPCAHGVTAIDRAWNAERAAAVRSALAADPAASGTVLAKLEASAAAWKRTHQATCRGDRKPSQPATTATCLEARRVELDGFVEDVIADRGSHAVSHVAIVGDPARCETPAPGLLSSRVPADPALRRRVTALRYQLFDAERARDAADFERALARAGLLVPQAAATWPHVHAEALYLLGTTQSQGGDSKQALQTLREAAAVAERAHHDYIAANCWIQLVLSSAFDEGNPARALEYATYGEAALDRLGRPADVEVMFAYVKGAALIEADRNKEAEVLLRRAVELAETSVPPMLPQAIQGLGYLYEDQGRFADAAGAYQRALAHLPAHGPGVASSAVVFRGRLAINLSLLGRAQEAETEARAAVDIAVKTLGEDNLDRAVASTSLAQVLQTNGRPDEALVIAERAARDIAGSHGERNERHGEALRLVASILVDLDRHREAVERFARACEVIAFQTGDGSSQQAECWIDEALALEGLQRDAEALALVERALPALIETYGDGHVAVASAYVQRGVLHGNLGHDAAARTDLERAIAQLEHAQIEPGHLAAAQWGLARHLWTKEPARARELLEQALTKFETAAATWRSTREDAQAWRDTNGRTAR